MPRADEQVVRQLVDNDASLSMQPFIESASSIVDRLDTEDTDNELSTATLKIIEQWLAAHFYASYDHQSKQEKDGDASRTVMGETGMYFESTPQGQAALMIDTTGILKQMQKEAKEGGEVEAGGFWLGKPKSAQIDYEDRD